eukprot:CAMPEP_0172516194 /NCGR_PEP_ID=MMETSP1066-20121228/274235_1 /TAXON_ID=671091 /ORGANISM="Coscinodiscus wailesii, Strain CCMP2513" /LENGTH=240 /DNA_ID=CAMNT_0013297567 /DNA_START=280 /DNA_END=1002 /DNA_ORIENTATION=+
MARRKKVSQLEKDLETLLEKQAKQETIERSKPWSESFKNFFRKNKTETMNIGACIVFVGLAAQVSSNRSATKRLIAKKMEQDEIIENMHKVFQRVKGDEFCGSLARQCATAIISSMDDVDGGSATTASNGGWFGWRRNDEKADLHNRSVDAEVLEQLMGPIIRDAIKNEIGAVYLDNSDKEEKEAEIIQNIIASTIGDDAKKDVFGGQPQHIGEVGDEQKQDEIVDGETTKVVRKRKFMM